MRIIYVTDLHGALERLELLLELTNADLYVIAGDLLYNPFYDLDSMERFYAVQREVRSWFPAGDGIALPLKLRAARSQMSASQRAVVDEYHELAEQARKSMLRKYRAMERIREVKPRVPMFFLPGNYDLDLSATALAPVSLHRRAVESAAGRIAGFGGAPVFTPGIPQHLAVRFRETAMGPEGRSEPAEVLRALDPDIAAVHVPPLGILDGSPSRPYGSWGIREFVDESERLRVLLCGHVHEHWGVRLARNGQVWVVNGGNFGPVVEATGYRRGGYFFELLLDEKSRDVEGVLLKRLERSRIWHLADYHRDSDGRLQETVIEPRRYGERRDRPIVATAQEAQGEAGKAFDIEELQLYNQIKLFMRRFETAESEERIDDLREIVRLARADGTEIAFDVLGSLNMGQSAAHSDVDAVLYIGDDPARNRFRLGYWPDLVHSVTGGRYEFELTDILVLSDIEKAILARDPANEELQRFVVYRTIGRPVNVRLLRRFDDLLFEAEDLSGEIQGRLRDDLRILLGTYRHTRSFAKYQERLREAGIRIPPRIQARIHRYLHALTGGSRESDADAGVADEG